MIHISEFLISKTKRPNIIHATNQTIKEIVKDELDKLGHNADLNHIDVSQVTNMSDLFSCGTYLGTNLGKGYEDINPDISMWDVRKVKTMDSMFLRCEKFNCDLSKWETENLEDARRLFAKCKEFNKDISNWYVGKVYDMREMFYGCEKFNQDISSWDVSKVTDMTAMFRKCTKFCKNLSKWETYDNVDYAYCFLGSKMLNHKKYWPHKWPWE